MRVSLGIILGTSALYVHARPSRNWGSSSGSWDLREFTSLVTFGDSYTDESRFGYFISHNGSAPPVGWVDPPNNDSASGGYTWPRFVAHYTGANLYDYAVGGAVCSNDITPHFLAAINADFPAVLQYEVPAYIADSKYYTNGKKFLDIPAHSTVYSIWIGTNDLGDNAFLTDSQVAGTTIPDYIACVYEALDQVYGNGARYFVLMNIAPLQLTPLYATPEAGGVAATQFWPNKPSNLTEISYRMWEQVVTVNDVYRHQTPFDVLVRNRYPGAKFAVMDMYGLISDIYYHPEQYLAAPANVTGFINQCNAAGTVCVREPNPNSYLWFDTLHPSQRTDEIIAQNFVKVVKGTSQWATYWG